MSSDLENRGFKIFHIQLSELSPAVKSAIKQNQRLLGKQLTSLHKQRATSLRHYEEQYSNIAKELEFSIRPRSVPLRKLTFPKQRLECTYRPNGQRELLRVPTWIPGLGETHRMPAKDVGIGLRVYSMIRANHRMKSDYDDERF